MRPLFHFLSQHSKVFILLLVLIINLNHLTSPALAQCKTGISGNGCPAAGLTQVQELMVRMINISTTLAFMAMTVWLAWSAIKFFITSGGDPKALSQAWSSVTWIFMGIVFMVLAFLALRLIAAFTGVNVTEFCLGFPPYCLDSALPVAPPTRDPNS